MDWREKVIQEAKTWMGTPHHNEARVKGAGVDCGQILIDVYETVGILKKGDCTPEHYPPDFALHRGEEKYLGWIQKFCDLIEGEPLPGDIVVFQYGRCISHAGILIGDNKLIHSYINRGVIISDLNESIFFDKKGSRLKGIYRPKVGD